MDSAQAQLADKLKTANNILVTVSRNPSVDQLAGCIALTLLLNKLGKHAAAVFSGQVPSTLEFLKPEDTIEKNTDSLRDFIIALDKSKADKLRYKVEDSVVRIFITPYKTSISEADLEFSQGDFNVDVVVALGVDKQEDLDEAITAHGRILHDAAVTSINTKLEGGLGSINWHDPQASSLSELLTQLAQLIGEDLLDSQIATALLTGIVAETNRFSNERTTSQTMSASAKLMAAGANQQLVATQLEEPAVKPEETAAPEMESQDTDQPTDDQPASEEPAPKSNDGTLEINHPESSPNEAPEEASEPTQSPDSAPSSDLPEELTLPVPAPELPNLEADAPDTSVAPEAEISEPAPAGEHLSGGARLMTEAPTLGGVLTANSQPEPDTEAYVNPLNMTLPTSRPALEHGVIGANSDTSTEEERFIAGLTPPPPAWVPPSNDPLDLADNSQNHSMESQTLSDIESLVHSPHTEPSSADTPVATNEDSPSHLDAARDEVSRALGEANKVPEPIQALNAQPMGELLHAAPPESASPTDQPGPGYVAPVADILMPAAPQEEPLHTDPMTVIPPSAEIVDDPNAPPKVPPPIPFQFGTPGATTP
jgi:hypothetical protein